MDKMLITHALTLLALLPHFTFADTISFPFRFTMDESVDAAVEVCSRLPFLFKTTSLFLDFVVCCSNFVPPTAFQSEPAPKYYKQQIV